MTRRRIVAAVLAVLAAVGISLSGATPALADGAPSLIAFSTQSPLLTPFGGNWVARVNTVYEGSDYPIPASSATVSVFIGGVTDAFVTGLPIQPDGAVYITQPASKPLLAAGQYQLTAVIVPVPGGNVQASQTAIPLVLTVSAYAIAADVSVDKSTLAEQPVLVAALSGDYVDTTKSVPAGTWTFLVTNGSKTVLSRDVAQDAGGTDPLRVPIDAALDDGTKYHVKATFAAVDSIAPGLTLTQAKEFDFSTPTKTLGDTLAAPVPFPIWALIVIATLFALLIAAAITLQVQLQKRRLLVPTDTGEGSQEIAPALAVAQVPVAVAVVHDPSAWLPEPAPTVVAPTTVEPTPAAPQPVNEPGEFTQLLMGPAQPAPAPAATPAPPVDPAPVDPASAPAVDPQAAPKADPDETASWSLLD